jgi:hypothetical protein
MNEMKTDLSINLINKKGSSDAVCLKDFKFCEEGNLDIQFITGVAPGIPTTFYYWDDEYDLWRNFLYKLTSNKQKDLVISISYVSYEEDFTNDYLRAFNTEMIKLSLQGITI